MAKGKKKEEQAAAGAPAWMMTYGDMMSLLLTFFVLIVSFSTIQEAGFKTAIGSLQGALGVLERDASEFILKHISHPEKLYAFLSSKLKQTLGNISDNLNFVNSIDKAHVAYDDQGARIILPASILFDSGKAEVKESSYPELKKVGAFLFENNVAITIEGHTDSQVIRSEEFASNWELSIGRALNVMHFFRDVCGIDYRNMSVAGFADNKPLASNATEAGREKNRRVEIVILGEKPKTYLLR